MVRKGSILSDYIHKREKIVDMCQLFAKYVLFKSHILCFLKMTT